MTAHAMIQDPLGDRMKAYEADTRLVLGRSSYAILRVDGRAFHSYTRGLAKPYDAPFQADMDQVALTLCAEISGAHLAYVQSDEISVVFSSLASARSEPYFGGVVQKIASVAAALASVTLSRLRPDSPPALFDARVFAIERAVEVHNYFVWRQADCRRNAISMLAHHYLSKKAVMGISTPERKLMLADHGVDLDMIDGGFLRGRHAVRETVVAPVDYIDKRTGEAVHLDAVERRVWALDAAPVYHGTDVIARALGQEVVLT